MSGSDGLRERLTSDRALKAATWGGVVVAAIAAFWIVVQLRGPFEATIYTFCFVVAAVFFPVLIAILGHGVPNLVGKLHLILGAVAFDHHYLVQREHAWEWCPGERGRVWIDDEWHEVKGEENYSVLGWRPFGILRYKDDATWVRERADDAAQDSRERTSPAADGGESSVERAGISEVSRPPVGGDDGTWLLDLKRVYSRGVRRIGDVELIETAEQIIDRGQLASGRLGAGNPTVQTLAALVLGVVTGFVYIIL